MTIRYFLQLLIFVSICSSCTDFIPEIPGTSRHGNPLGYFILQNPSFDLQQLADYDPDTLHAILQTLDNPVRVVNKDNSIYFRVGFWSMNEMTVELPLDSLLRWLGSPPQGRIHKNTNPANRLDEMVGQLYLDTEALSPYQVEHSNAFGRFDLWYTFAYNDPYYKGSTTASLNNDHYDGSRFNCVELRYDLANCSDKAITSVQFSVRVEPDYGIGMDCNLKGEIYGLHQNDIQLPPYHYAVYRLCDETMKVAVNCNNSIFNLGRFTYKSDLTLTAIQWKGKALTQIEE